MSARQSIHILLPATFFVAGIFAAIGMELVIGQNFENSLRQLVFIPPEPRPLIGAGFWFGTSVVCLISTIVTDWRAFRHLRHAKHI